MRPTHSNKKCVVIITSGGKSLGMGHIQRMSSLLVYLNTLKKIKAFLVSDTGQLLPKESIKYKRNNIDFSPDIIVRDMRDSTEEEILLLRKKLNADGKICVIDDNGPGRSIADSAIDILPNPLNKNTTPEQMKIFIYGYNFFNAVGKLKNKKIIKELDFAIYPGNSASGEYIEFIAGLLPGKASYAILKGKDSYIVKNSVRHAVDESSYAKIILSAKLIISHFGITLYEGAIAKCGLISINPTEYHSKLADMVKDDLKILNLGDYKRIDSPEAADLIQEKLTASFVENINADEVYSKIINSLEGFSSIIL